MELTDGGDVTGEAGKVGGVICCVGFCCNGTVFTLVTGGGGEGEEEGPRGGV